MYAPIPSGHPKYLGRYLIWNADQMPVWCGSGRDRLRKAAVAFGTSFLPPFRFGQQPCSELQQNGIRKPILDQWVFLKCCSIRVYTKIAAGYSFTPSTVKSDTKPPPCPAQYGKHRLCTYLYVDARPGSAVLSSIRHLISNQIRRKPLTMCIFLIDYLLSHPIALHLLETTKNSSKRTFPPVVKYNLSWFIIPFTRKSS